jgi:uncharacterized protein YoxC
MQAPKLPEPVNSKIVAISSLIIFVSVIIIGQKTSQACGNVESSLDRIKKKMVFLLYADQVWAYIARYR